MSEPHKKYFLTFLPDLDDPTQKGATLYPLSGARKAAADAMGAKFFRLGDEEWAELVQRGTYPGIVMDTIIILWVMTLPAGRVAKACVNSIAALNQAMEWAAANEMTAGEKNFPEAQEVLSEVLLDLVKASNAARKAAETDEDDEDSDEDTDEEDSLGET